MLKTTQLERRLIEAAQAGQLLDVSNESERDIRAVVIRGLLCGWHTKALDARGVRLRGAHIVEKLDLTDVRASVPLTLHACEHDDPIVLTRAHLPYLDLTESAFPELFGNDFACEHNAQLRDVRCGQLSLTSASLVGDCDLRGAQLTATNEPALSAAKLVVGRDLRLDQGFAASSNSDSGTLSLPSVSVTGQLSLRGAHLAATNGPAVHADDARFGSSLFLDEGFTASSDSEHGTIHLIGANITGLLVMRSAQLTASAGPALVADGATIGSSMRLNEGFTASSDSEQATIHLLGANITGQLNLRGAHLAATNGPAVHADGARFGSSLLLDKGFTASSDSEQGTIRLIGANIRGLLVMRSAQLTATNGPALLADAVRICDSLFLDGGFTASSDSQRGAVRLLDANITGQLSLSRAKLTASNGPALYADRATFGGSLLLDEGFTASSVSEEGTIRLIGADITTEFNLGSARLTAVNGPALVADGATTGRTLFLHKDAAARSNSEDGTLRIRNTSIAENFTIRDAEIQNIGPSKRTIDMRGTQISGDLNLPLVALSSQDNHQFCVDIDGLRYPFIPHDGQFQDWLTLLSKHTLEYAAQPYQQLAAVYGAAGHHQEARKIFIAQQRDLRHRGDLGGRGRKFLHALSGLFIGYGHRPFRALAFLAGVCLLSGGVVLTASLLGLTAHPAPSDVPCSLAENFSLAMDTAIPLLKYGGGKRCEILATTDWGQALYVATYFLHMLGWAFATLFVAGYTGLVRKTT